MRVFRIIAALSAILCVCGAALWVRSLWFYDGLGWESETKLQASWDRRFYAIYAISGGFTIYHSYARATDGPSNGYFLERPLKAPGRVMWNSHIAEDLLPSTYRPVLDGFHLLGFQVGSREDKNPKLQLETTNRWISVPYWFVVVATAVLPSWWVWTALRRRRRRNSGLCANCGYDLRATPEQCPECGVRVAGA